MLFIPVEELYGGLTEEKILDTVREAAFSDTEYQNIKDNVLKLYSS